MLKPIYRSSVIALACLGLVACGGSDSSDPGTGVLSLDVTDATVDNVEKVLVQFVGVTVQHAEGGQESLPLSGDSQTCQELLDGVEPSPTPEGESTVRCIELKELQGTDSASLLDGETLTAGKYPWMRLDVQAERGVMDSMVVLDDGGIESLYIPSGSESGLKLNTGFTILAGGLHDFVIDFDLRKSVNDPQGFSDYRLRPSLRMVDMAVSGNITGSVDADLLTADGCTGDINTETGYAVYVYEGGADTTTGDEGSEDAPLTSASVGFNADSGLYEYTVGYVAPGEYKVVFTCQAADDDSELGGDVIEFVESADSPTTVVANEDSVVDFTVSVE